MSARAFGLAPTIRTIALAALLSAAVPLAQAADTVTVGGQAFVNKGLVGVGRLPADLRDKFGETVGSGSGLAADLKTWTRGADGYQGTFYLLPDRGYNITGTTDFRARLYQLSIAFKPSEDPSALPADARQKSVAATLTDTILLTDAAGQPMTGLDPSQGGIRRAANGFPDLPQASTGRVSLDSEALVLMPDGTFFIGDDTDPTSIASRPMAACFQRRVRPTHSFPGATARITSRPTIRGPAPMRRSRKIPIPDGRTIRALKD